MYCMKCEKHLSQCDCPDLEERLASLYNSEHILVSEANRKAYDEQAKRNKEHQTRQE